MSSSEVAVSEEVLIKRFTDIRKQTENICSPLYKEDYIPQPIIDVSPPKWHLGHTTWFFENFILVDQIKNFSLFNSKFNYIFNSYYESQGPRIHRSNRGNLSRPSVEEVYEYRKYVDNEMLQFISTNHLSEKLKSLIEVGLQHEQQHQELLITDIKYILGNNPLFPVYREKPQTTNKITQAKQSFIKIPERMYEIGHQGDEFCFDNELNNHLIFLNSFEISNSLITNSEYLNFINDNGYERAELWLSEGWAWIQENNIQSPEYWYLEEEWLQYSLHGLQKLNPNEPVTHISYFEAEAYARWKKMRLATEFEWEIACKHIQPSIEEGNFIESNHFHPTTNHHFLGNVWEWTSSAYLPYPNYPQYKGALGEYNGKFMVNQMVLRGGSCATPKSHIRNTYRNFFHPDKRWQFTGIRLVK